MKSAIKKILVKHRHLVTGIGVSLLLVLVNTYALWSARIIPFGDGGVFYKYALELYGFLHSGQSGLFLETLTAPTKNLFPTSILFLFLPHGFSNSAGYGFVNSLGWHVFLAIGVYLFLRAINRTSLTTAILLLTCANVLAFDPAYYFYMDFSFMALHMVALGMAACAVVTPSRKNMIWAGVCAALPFLSKATNAFTTLALLGLFMAVTLIARVILLKQVDWRSFILRSVGFWSLGFVPVFLLAAYLGAFESILNQIAAYTVDSGWVTVMTEAGYKRWFYFPLCLTYYYSIPLICIFLGALLVCRYIPARLRSWTCADDASGPRGMTNALILGSVFFFVIVYGLYFSFFLQCKVIRSLPFMLPILWIAILACTSLRRVKAGVTISLSALVFIVVWGQAELGVLSAPMNRSAVYYEIKGDWYNRWPAKRPDLTQGASITAHLYSLLIRAGVHKGKVAVGSQMMFWGPGDLATVCNQNALRQGKKPPYIFETIGSTENFPPLRKKFENADALLLILEPRAQYSQLIYQQNVMLTNYAMQNWKDKHADILLTQNEHGQPSVCVVSFRKSLTEDMINAAQSQGALKLSDLVVEARADCFKDASILEKVRILSGRD